jgi:hypothetical protein
MQATHLGFFLLIIFISLQVEQIYGATEAIEWTMLSSTKVKVVLALFCAVFVILVIGSLGRFMYSILSDLVIDYRNLSSNISWSANKK